MSSSVRPHQARHRRVFQSHRRLADVPVQRRRRQRHRLASRPSRHAGQFRRGAGDRRGDACRAPRPHHPWLHGALFRSTTRRRWRASSRIAGAPAPPSSASRSRMPAARPPSQRPWEGGGALPPGQDPWETIAPSPLPFGPNWHVPRVATLEDIARVREAFVNSAKRAVRIGFDAIELHYAHGYLAHSFLSPVSNHRTDQYGGSLENRMRFGLEIAQAVRTAVPKSIALGARITGSDWRDDGLSTDDAVTYSKALKADGLDYIDVSSGGITADTRNPTATGLQRADRRAGQARGRHHHPRGRADLDAGAGRGDRRRRQGRHGGAGARHARRSALGLARGGGARRRGAARAAVSARRSEALGAGGRTRRA